MLAIRVGDLRPHSRALKNRCEVPAKADNGTEAARPFLALPSSSLIPTACRAARRLPWMIWKASAQASQISMSWSVSAWRSGA